MNRCEETGIYYVGEYHTYWICGEHNPKFNKQNGGYILDLKKNIATGVEYYIRKVKKEFKNYSNVGDFNIITVIPSSKKDKISTGLVSLVSSIADDYENMEYIQCLNRNKDVEKKANGGLRSKELELKTIDAVNIDKIKDANIFLFDDVTTTGTSLISGKEILLKNGAKKVVCIALGKTVQD